MGEIAEQLVLSSNTVSIDSARILEKTGVRNDVELARYAVREGFCRGWRAVLFWRGLGHRLALFARESGAALSIPNCFGVAD